MTTKAISSKGIDPGLKHFDELPGSARVDVKVVAAIRGCSVPTVWRHVRQGLLPAPEKLGGCTRWLVRDIRASV